MRSNSLPIWLLLLLVFTSSACDRKADRRELHIFADASLKETFAQLEKGFEAAHTDVDVKLVLASTDTLRDQMSRGAQPDIFASPDIVVVQKLTDQGRITSYDVFAENELVIVVPPDNPAGIESFDELTRATTISVAAPETPAGTQTEEFLRRLRKSNGDAFADDVETAMTRPELDVRMARVNVEHGNADAAIVFRTEARASPRVGTVEIPQGVNVRARYAHGTLASSNHRQLARRWRLFVGSERGREILVQRGLIVP